MKRSQQILRESNGNLRQSQEFKYQKSASSHKKHLGKSDLRYTSENRTSPHYSSNTFAKLKQHNENHHHVPQKEYQTAQNFHNQKSFETSEFDLSVNDSFGRSPLKEREYQTMNNDRRSPKLSENSYSQTDIKLMHKELGQTRKLLNETQARCTNLTKDLSRAQHEYQTANLANKRTEVRCQELIERHSDDVQKIKELNYINSQLQMQEEKLLQNEVNKLKQETQENTSKTKDNLDKLKRNLADVERVIESRNDAVANTVKKLRLTTFQVNRIVEATDESLIAKTQQLFDNINGLSSQIIEIIGCQTPQDLSRVQDLEEFDSIKPMNDIISRYEKENAEYKENLQRMTNQLHKEQVKTREIIPQYRESVNRLRKNTSLLKEKLKEIQDIRLKEKDEYEADLNKVQQKQDRTTRELESVQSLNEELNRQIKDSEQALSNNQAQIRKLIEENQKLIRAGAYINSKNEDDNYPSFKDRKERFETVNYKNTADTDFTRDNIDIQNGGHNRNDDNNSSLEYSKFQNTMTNDNKNEFLDAIINTSTTPANQPSQGYKGSMSSSKVFPNENYENHRRHSFTQAKAQAQNTIFNNTNELPPRYSSTGFENTSNMRNSSVNAQQRQSVSAQDFYSKNYHSHGFSTTAKSKMRLSMLSDNDNNRAYSTRGSARELQEDVAMLDNEIEDIQKMLALEMGVKK